MAVVEHKEQGKGRRRPVHWWPVPGADLLGDEVPVDVAEAFDEGVRCLAVQAARGAAAMFRLMLAYLIDQLASPGQPLTGRTLAAQLTELSNDGRLHPSLADWASHIRLLGNAGVHANEPKNQPPTLEEVEGLRRLCRQIIENVYVIPARIARDRQASSSAS